MQLLRKYTTTTVGKAIQWFLAGIGLSKSRKTLKIYAFHVYPP